MDKEKTLLVITPSKGRDCPFYLLHAETGEGLAVHFCSHEGFAYGDLYANRPERVKEWTERFGELEVKYLDETDLTEKIITERNKEWYDKHSEESGRGE